MYHMTYINYIPDPNSALKLHFSVSLLIFTWGSERTYHVASPVSLLCPTLQCACDLFHLLWIVPTVMLYSVQQKSLTYPTRVYMYLGLIYASRHSSSPPGCCQCVHYHKATACCVLVFLTPFLVTHFSDHYLRIR